MKGIKIILWICAISCLLAFVLAVLPWQTLTSFFEALGGQPLGTSGITVFMVRLCLLLFGLIGVFFTILARDPLKYSGMLQFAGFWLVIYGIYVLAAGIRYELPAWIYGEFFFSVGFGLILFCFRKSAFERSTA